MVEDIISAIIYTDVDNELGPNPTLWIPSDISEDLKLQVGIKTITLLTAEKGLIPESLVVMPFPSLKMKSLIKYLEWEDNSKRGFVAHSAITLLFNEVNDVIFYKAMEHLDPIFNDFGRKIIELEKSNAKRSIIISIFMDIKKSVMDIIAELRSEEESEAFPESEELLSKNINYQFKVIICGDPMVGKTSLILRFTQNAFKRTYISTLGVSVSDKIISIADYTIQLVLWDIAGQQKFETMRSAFYKGAKGVLLIFDLTNPKTFNNIINWYNDIKREIEIDIVGVIIGNKADLSIERKNQFEEAKKLADSLNLEYIETSALTGKNVNDCFKKLAEKLFLINK